MSSTDCISVTTVVATDPATAFAIFTEEIHLWWKPKARNVFRQGPAGVLRFEPGPDGRLLEIQADGARLEIGRVTAWEPGKKLAFEWRELGFQPSENTEVEVRFEANGQGTRITLQHRGWDALPPDHPARRGARGEAFVAMMGLRWADELTALRQRVPSRR